MKKVKVVAFLPVKGSSERIESKNTKLLDGKPLFLHTLEKLVSCNFIDEVYLDSESEEIFEIASEINCKKLIRDKSLATNKTDGNKLFMNEVNSVNAEIYIQILCTSPFISTNTIKEGIKILSESDEHDSVVLTQKEKMYLWKNGKPVYDINNIPNSKDLDDTVIETMGLYIIKRNAAKKLNRRIGEKPYLITATPLEAIDVNYPDDFKLAELIQAGKREKERKLYNNIKNLINSPMLSDILDELGYKNQIIRELKINLPNKKILGKAKTLKLRKLGITEDYKGIYNALESYKTIVPGDIILVENEVPDYAYFGEMNANLAIRSGAIATIIGGKTRDSEEVKKLDYITFSRGYTCQDVKLRATTESINKTINIENIKIRPGDLVFGDADGIVIIPKEIEKEVLNKAFQTIEIEKSIVLDVARDLEEDDLVNKNGYF